MNKVRQQKAFVLYFIFKSKSIRDFWSQYENRTLSLKWFLCNVFCTHVVFQKKRIVLLKNA